MITRTPVNPIFAQVARLRVVALELRSYEMKYKYLETMHDNTNPTKPHIEQVAHLRAIALEVRP